jgi:hypothetical protein
MTLPEWNGIVAVSDAVTASLLAAVMDNLPSDPIQKDHSLYLATTSEG